jgi:Fe2+ transport system protein B
MKDENKRLEETNQELVARIRKESKFNELYEKKMDKIAIEAMPFEKILEIKLLLEVEELEEMLRNKEENLEQLIKTNKKKKESLHHSILDPFVDLHALLLEDSASVSRKRQEREDELKQSDDNLNELY